VWSKSTVTASMVKKPARGGMTIVRNKWLNR
jgi:hypothetical protein